MLRLNTFGGLFLSGDGAPPPGQVRPRRLALLAIVAAAGPRGISRDHLLSILWGDSSPDRARHSLSQALYSLRKDFGGDVVLASTSLRLDETRISSDVDDFRSAVADSAWERAARLCTGPFLDGFYLADAPLFEQWAEEQRDRLSREAMAAVQSAMRLASSEGRPGDVVVHSLRLATLDPLDGSVAAIHMKALAAAGDRAGALRYGQAHAALVARELEVEPDVAVLAMLEELRSVVAAERVAPLAPGTASGGTPARRSAPLRLATWEVGGRHHGAETASAPRSRQPMRRRLFAVGAMALVLAAASSTPLLRRALARDGASSRVAGTASRSPVAERFYQEGLRAFHGADPVDASRLFNAAVREDSSFIMAAYFAWRAEVLLNGAHTDSLADRAMRLAALAGEQERLLVHAHVRASRWDVGAVALADSLAIRYPSDVTSLIVAADVTADLSRAVALLERAIAIDSAASAKPGAICRACEGLRQLAHRYDWADSARGVIQTLDRWTALRPDDYSPWEIRADYLVGLGQLPSSRDAMRRADSLGAPRRDSAEALLARSLRSDDVDAANALCRQRLASSDEAVYTRARWLCTIGLRMQGRHRDALGLAREGRNPWTASVRRGVPVDRSHGAILDMEMGRSYVAARQFVQLASDAERSAMAPGVKARAIAWQLTLAATAAARGGDTLLVRALVDSVELVGHRSLFSRDPLLHHFLRGVLHAEAGAHEAAVREFRAAMSSPSQGYTRINYELGRSLLALGRPADAIVVLRAPLRGGLEGSGLYLTRTEIHESLARAFSAAGQRDSATAHYAVVERSWRLADSAFADRYQMAKRGGAGGA